MVRRAGVARVASLVFGESTGAKLTLSLCHRQGSIKLCSVGIARGRPFLRVSWPGIPCRKRPGGKAWKPGSYFICSTSDRKSPGSALPFQWRNLRRMVKKARQGAVHDAQQDQRTGMDGGH